MSNVYLLEHAHVRTRIRLGPVALAYFNALQCAKWSSSNALAIISETAFAVGSK